MLNDDRARHTGYMERICVFNVECKLNVGRIETKKSIWELPRLAITRNSLAATTIARAYRVKLLFSLVNFSFVVATLPFFRKKWKNSRSQLRDKEI